MNHNLSKASTNSTINFFERQFQKEMSEKIRKSIDSFDILREKDEALKSLDYLEEREFELEHQNSQQPFASSRFSDSSVEIMYILRQ